MLLYVNNTDIHAQLQSSASLSLVKTNNHFTVMEGTPILLPGHTKTDYSATGVPGLQKGSCPSELVVYVHGYWNSQEEDFLPIFTTARESLNFNKYYFPLVGFSWDSKFFNWWTAKKMAAEVGPKLGQFILDFKNKCPLDNIRLIAHSLGARVTLTALNFLNANTEWNDRNFRIESIHLLGAAVDNEQVSKNFDDCAWNFIPVLPCSGMVIENEVERFTNLYNSEDNVLEFIYPIPELDWALGEDGAEEDISLPSNYRQQDVIRELPDEDDHITYRGELENGVLVSDGAMDIVVKDWNNQGIKYPVINGQNNGYLAQGNFGQKGNFELVIPLSEGGFAQFWRDNDSPNLKWNGPFPITSTDGNQIGTIDALSLVQSNFGTPGLGESNMVTRIGDRLALFWQEDKGSFPWHGPYYLPGSGFAGDR